MSRVILAPLRNVKLVPFFAFSIFGRQATFLRADAVDVEHLCTNGPSYWKFAIGIFEGDYPRKMKMETVKGKLE